MNLSEHFTLEELTFSDYAVRNSIDNSPDDTTIEHLTILAQGLEEIRSLLNSPININSGYRGILLNKALGGVTHSAHVDGYAADFTSRGFGTPEQIVRLIKDSGIKYDQVIYEGTWVHISFAPTMRQESLLATFSNGRATYSLFS